MKKYIILLASILLFSNIQAENETEGKSQIESVTVFLQGAQVTRESTVSLKKGKNAVYFRGLGEGINPQSIQVSAPEAFLIHGVVHEVNYLQRHIEEPKVKMLQDSLDIIKKLVEGNQMEHAILESEKTLILKNKSLASKEQGVNIDELMRTSDFYRSRLTEILKKQLKFNRSSVKLGKRRSAIKAQLNELRARRNRPSNDIKVIIETDAAGNVPLTFSYLISEAGWIPSYNLRAKDSNSPITLEYRADVFQNTGVDWENIDMTLSSGNPNAGGVQPKVSPWYLSIVQPYILEGRKSGAKPGYYKSAAPKMEAVDKEQSEAEESDDDWGDEAEEVVEEYDGFDEGPATTLADYTVVKEGATTAEFKISIKQSIPSNGKPEQVSVQDSELPASFQHFAVPKLDNDAFLTAGVTGWETLNLLPGNAQIFLAGTYVSEAFLDPASTEDTLMLSLGRDKKVVIERNQLKDFNKTRTIGFNRERTFAYEIKVRNTKEGPVQITLEDQIPVSQNKDIVVKLVEDSGAKLNEETGKLIWELELAKAETKTIKLIFSVKHPKNKYVNGI